MTHDESTACKKNQVPLHCPAKAMLYSLTMLMNERLKKARNNVKLTLAAVGDRVGVSPQAISQWETGETLPNMEHLLKVAKIYRVPAEALEDGDDPLPPPGPDKMQEFLKDLADLGEAIPEAQREQVIKILEAFIPKPPEQQKSRQRAS